MITPENILNNFDEIKSQLTSIDENLVKEVADYIRDNRNLLEKNSDVWGPNFRKFFNYIPQRLQNFCWEQSVCGTDPKSEYFPIVYFIHEFTVDILLRQYDCDEYAKLSPRVQKIVEQEKFVVQEKLLEPIYKILDMSGAK